MYTTLLFLFTTCIAQFTIKLSKTPGFLQFAIPIQVGTSQLNFAIDTTDPFHVLYSTLPNTSLRTALTVPPRVCVARQEEIGPVLTDRFSIGNASVTNIPFTFVSSASPLNGVSGIIGLGHPIETNSSILHSLVAQRQIPELKFGYCIDTTAQFASLDMGFFTHPGPFEFVRVIAPTWRSIVNATSDQTSVAVPHGVPIESVSFGTFTSTTTAMIGYVHTNIGLTHLPRQVMDSITTQIRTTTNGIFYDVVCADIASFPTLTLKFSTATLKWSGSEYTLKRPDGTCFLAFTVYTTPLIQDSAILGTALLRKYYLAFDRNTHQIGFALSSTHKVHDKPGHAGNSTRSSSLRVIPSLALLLLSLL